VGVFEKKFISSNIDMPDNIAFPPVYTIELFENKEKIIDKNYLQFLALYFDAPEAETKQKTQAYIHSIINDLFTKGERNINGLGTLKNLNNHIQFYRESIPSEKQIKAQKIIRENSVLQLKVGDKEMSNEEMAQLLSNREKQNFSFLYWSIGILGCLLLILAILYFS